eukprot:UN33633
MKELWHGVRTMDPEDLFRAKESLDMRVSKKGLYGRGIYFAESAAYSDNGFCFTFYKDGVQRYKILLCDVMLGRIKTMGGKTDQNITKLKNFDSVWGKPRGQQNSSMHIVYDNTQVLVKYVVEYKKQIDLKTSCPYWEHD